MATRSQIIAKAKAKIVQGSEDPFWSDEWWNDKYHQVCESVRKEIVDSELKWFIVRNQTLTKDSEDLYPLPSDCDSIIWVKESTADDPIFEVSDEEEHVLLYAGFKIINGSLELVNYGSLPDTIKIEYYRKIKEIGDWDGTEDPDTNDYKQYAPLDTPEAARVLSDLLSIFAMVKDESLSSSQAELVQALVSNFVNKLGTRNKQSPNILGY